MSDDINRGFNARAHFRFIKGSYLMWRCPYVAFCLFPSPEVFNAVPPFAFFPCQDFPTC